MSRKLRIDETGLAGAGAAGGAPRREDVTLAVGSMFSAVHARPERVAEVVFAIQRRNRRLLLHTKNSYPPGVCRLPSGGVRAGEPVMAALWREVAEETSLQATLLRYLAVIHYTIVVAKNDQPGDPMRTFTSYLFLLQETGGELHTADEDEHVAGFREIELSELPDVAQVLEALAASPDSEARSWGDWGRFRAVAHRVVWDMLREGEMPVQAG